MKDRLGVIVVFASKILIALLGVVLLSLETKFIEPSMLGEYALLSGLINAGISIFVSWVGSSALRYYDKNKNNIEVFNSTILFGGIVSTIIFLAVITVIGLIIPKLYIMKYYILVVLLIIFKSIFEIYEKVLRASANFTVYSLLTVLQFVISVGIFYILAHCYPNDISTLFVALIISFVIFDVFAWYISKSFKGVSVSRISSEMNNSFMNYGIPMIGVWAISWLLNYSDRYMINFYYSTYEVGIYTTAYTISQSSIGIFTSSITLTFFPVLIKRWNSSGRVVATNYVNKILDYYILLMIPAVVGLFLVANYFYGTLIDKKYIEGAIVIGLAAVGFFFSGLNTIMYKLWQLEEKTQRIFGLMVISFLINVIGNAILLPIFGYIAAAYTTIFSYMLIFSIAFLWVRKTFKIEVQIIQILKSVVSLIPMCIILIVNNKFMESLTGLIALVVLSGCIYLFTQIMLGNFREEFLMVVNKIKGA